MTIKRQAWHDALSGGLWHQGLVTSPLVCISHQQVPLGSRLIGLTQHRHVLFLLLALPWKAQKSFLLCGLTLEVWRYDPLLLIRNHGSNSTLLQSLALLQSISNPTGLAKANADQHVANWIPEQHGKSLSLHWWVFHSICQNNRKQWKVQKARDKPEPTAWKASQHPSPVGCGGLPHGLASMYSWT